MSWLFVATCCAITAIDRAIGTQIIDDLLKLAQRLLVVHPEDLLSSFLEFFVPLNDRQGDLTVPRDRGENFCGCR